MAELGRESSAYDRRQSDRYLQLIERQLEALVARVDILERDGSRGHVVLAQRVTDSEQRRVDLIRENERAHERLQAEVESLERAVNKLEATVVQTNLDKLPERMDQLEDDRLQRTGAQAGLLRVVGPYAGFLFGLVAVIFAFVQASGH